MAQPVSTPLRMSTVLAIALLPNLSWAAEEPRAPERLDPVIDAVIACYGTYVTDYTSIANTATQIADRAALNCYKQWHAFKNEALMLSVETAADPAAADAMKNEFVSLLETTSRQFAIEAALSLGATDE